jgi:hypothetical protein
MLWPQSCDTYHTPYNSQKWASPRFFSWVKSSSMWSQSYIRWNLFLKEKERRGKSFFFPITVEQIVDFALLGHKVHTALGLL